jgi:hypothetical protein
MKAGRLLRTRSLASCLIVVYLALQVIIFRTSVLQQPTESSEIISVPLLNQPGLGGEGHPIQEVETTISVSISMDLEQEVQNGLAYARGITDTQRKLVFVHIPKTAGTTIEEAGGLQAKVAWGSCLFNHKPKRRGGVCRYPPGQFEWPMKIGYWHLPTQLFPLKGTNPYENADLFAVVRDPYDRLLSEFYYICRKKITQWWDAVECNRTRIHDPDYMNEWMQEKLQRTLTPASERMSSNDKAQVYLDHNGHFTPQYDFIVAPGGIRTVDYVLRMDNLQPEFTALMKAYGMDAALSPHKKNVARNDTNDLQARHFDSKTRSLIHEKYEHDAELLQRNRRG